MLPRREALLRWTARNSAKLPEKGGEAYRTTSVASLKIINLHPMLVAKADIRRTAVDIQRLQRQSRPA